MNQALVIKFAHSDLSVACVGTVHLTPTIFFNGTTKKAIKFKHSFEVLPLRSESSNYDFILGVDLIPTFFPEGLPVCFMPEAAQARSLPVMVSTVTFNPCPASESVECRRGDDNDSMDSFPLTSDISEQLKSLEASISDVGAGYS